MPGRETVSAPALAGPLTALVGKAAAAIRAMPAATVELRVKNDGSTVTAADEAAERIILDGLASLAPGIPVVSEEQMARGDAPALAARFFLVDPLDGTREYVAGRDEYAVNLALIEDGTPVLGIIAAPAHGIVWRGIVGHGAERLASGDITAARAEPIRTRPWPGADALATVSRSHLDPHSEALLARLPVTHRVAMGSALKFTRLAEGGADVYPRLAPTSEWDVAAGHALLVAAGGAMTAADSTPLTYGGSGRNFIVPGFVAWGDPRRAQVAGRDAR